MASSMDIDVDMDLDIDPGEDYNAIESVQLNQDPPKPMITLPSSDVDALHPTPHKVHLRGLDNLTSSDLKTYATTYFDSPPFDKVEWIDDTSANLVYASPAVALLALAAFAAEELNNISELDLMRMIPAKPFPTHPESRLELRLAVFGDRKQAGARERSRFYLFNPEHDRVERSKRELHSRRTGRNYRDRDDYRPRGRRGLEEFDASLYDDDEVARAARISNSHSRAGSKSSFSSEEHKSYRSMNPRKAVGKELFPDRISHRNGGRLQDRDRSASPLDDRDGRLRRSESVNGGTANRLKAQMIKARLKETSTEPRELFPQKASIIHRRSDAFDAADATADLFANRMPVPFLDGSSDISLKKNRDLASRITAHKLEDRVSQTGTTDQGFNIRGVAKQQPVTSFSIKGIASVSGSSSKELFPNRMTHNSGKELFSEKLDGRGGQRRKAEDMFY